MPHFRNRHLIPLLQTSLRFSSIVGIFGHRQVGKTTLAERLGDRYVTLDSLSHLEQASAAPESFLDIHKGFPLAIDECQMAPPLFPALKESVRKNKKPGQYLLTGSVRFSSRRAIRESLTGRIITWDLLPMDFSESHGLELGNAIPRLIESASVEIHLLIRKHWSSRSVSEALVNGGLPGIFAIRNPAIRSQRFETQINILLERDLKLVFQTSLSYSTLRNLLALLSLKQNQPLEWADLSRQSRISVPTLRKLLTALENIFVIRILPTEGSERKSVLFLEDQGEATHLSGGRYDRLTDLTRFLFAHLRVQFVYRPELQGRIFQYRNRSGGYVPLCFAIGKRTLGIIPTLEDRPRLGDLRSAQSFLKKYAHSKIIFTHDGIGDHTIQRNMRSVGIGQLV